MIGFWIFIGIIALGICAMFGYTLGSVMTTAKIADEQAEKLHKENETDV